MSTNELLTSEIETLGCIGLIILLWAFSMQLPIPKQCMSDHTQNQEALANLMTSSEALAETNKVNAQNSIVTVTLTAFSTQIIHFC